MLHLPCTLCHRLVHVCWRPAVRAPVLITEVALANAPTTALYCLSNAPTTALHCLLLTCMALSAGALVCLLLSGLSADTLPCVNLPCTVCHRPVHVCWCQGTHIVPGGDDPSGVPPNSTGQTTHTHPIYMLNKPRPNGHTGQGTSNLS